MDLLQIKDNLTNEYQRVKVTKYSVDYDKIWGSSVTNMEGSTHATLIGILPIIKATTSTLYQHGARSIGNLLNQGYMWVKFYDNLSGTVQEEQYICTSDISIRMIRENGKWYEEVDFTLKPVDIQGVIS